MTAVASSDRHEVVRRLNIEAVHDALAGGGPMTRDEIKHETGLSRPTVGALVAALVAQGLIRTVDMPAVAPRSAGRVATRYELDLRVAHVIGIDVGGTSSRFAIADLAGVILAEQEVRTTRRGGPAVVAQLADLAHSVTARAGVAWGRVGIVSVATPGVENDDGTIRLADNVPGLDTTPLAAALGDELARQVVWENDVNAAAIGEHRAGVARGCSSFVLLSVGTGLGLGIMIDGELVRGGRGAAGEVAYLPIGADATAARVRRRGAFEVAAAGSGVVQIFRDECAARAAAAPRRVTAHDVYVSAGRGDPTATAAVHRHAALLAQGILSVSALLDPEMVVLGGGIGTNPALLGPLGRAVERAVPWPVQIEPSALGPRAGLVGAVHRGLLAMPRCPIEQVSSLLSRKDVIA